MRTLMPVKTAGSRPPLFCVNGEPLKMALSMPEDQPLYGLCDAYHPYFEPPERIEQLAELYMREMQLVQPEGPYYIIGFSLGGLIAYAVAEQFRKNNIEVAYLGLIDPSSMRVSANNKEWVASRASLARGLLTAKGGITRLLIRIYKSVTAQTYTRYRLFKVIVYETLGKELPVNMRRIRNMRAILQSVRGYNYQPLDISGAVFHTETKINSAEAESAYTAYWSGLFERGVEVIKVSGVQEHLEFLAPENLERVTGKIMSDIHAAQETR
jgi:thioesterase domain-containing protein